ncbi:unnamed protein product [Lupinus luteus]|uniref:Uncharacterized protein n=1 Tax=Lupinus luteus TaxID=3873 RepID=A0AAV1WAK3_LUPLU
MDYSPCVGMSRKERMEYAQKLGLNPPIKIKKILENEKGCCENAPTIIVVDYSNGSE